MACHSRCKHLSHLSPRFLRCDLSWRSCISRTAREHGRASVSRAPGHESRAHNPNQGSRLWATLRAQESAEAAVAALCDAEAPPWLLSEDAHTSTSHA